MTKELTQLLQNISASKLLKKTITVGADDKLIINFELEEQSLEFDQIVVTATRSEAEQKDVPVIVNVLSSKTFEITSSK